jgi:hypothetical protein
MGDDQARGKQGLRCRWRRTLSVGCVFGASNTMAEEEEEAATAPEEIVESLLAESGVVLGAPGVKKLVKELKVSAVSLA